MARLVLCHQDMNTVVWVDLKHATLFHLAPSGVERKQLHSSRIDHHTHRLEGDERDSPSLYDRIAGELKSSSQVLIVGPGIAKYHLLARLRENFPLVAKKISGCEPLDHLTDGEIVAYARKHYEA